MSFDPLTKTNLTETLFVSNSQEMRSILIPWSAETRVDICDFGFYEYNQRDVTGQWNAILNDLTDVTGEAFMGLGYGCARCH